MSSWNFFNSILAGFRKFPLFKWAYKLSWAPSVYHYTLALIGALVYRFPSKKLTVIGVTGTKGKTTVVELINTILETAGEKTALVSSTRFKLDDKSENNETGNTQPGRFFLQYFLREAVKKGCRYAIIEVGSEGIILHRHKFIDFDVAVFIGLHPEHIESHGSLEKYREAKLDFFRDVKKHSKKKNKKFVINKNNEHSKYFAEIAGSDAIFYEKYNGQIKMAGEFNKENAAAAAEVTRVLGISEDIIKGALSEFAGVPGRMEFVQKNPFKAVVDYAHTPDSLEMVYKTLKAGGGNLICVLGSAGGGRDRWKRPKLGKVASKYCKEIILTDEDPFDENPGQILSEIKSGISKSEFPMTNIYTILDRKEAIKKAASLANMGDTLILTGKGSEPYIRIAKGKRIPWSDVDVLGRVLAEK